MTAPARSGVRITNREWGSARYHFHANAQLVRRGVCGVVQAESQRGRSLTICGAGPSLADHADRTRGPDAVWGCNDAVAWLVEHSYPVTHGLAIGAEASQVDAWGTVELPRGFRALLSSFAHPGAVQGLLDRRVNVSFFHSVIGFPGEMTLLRTFPKQNRWFTGRGLNVVNRALGLALLMGFEHVTILGADCAFNPDQLYADGRTFAEVYGQDKILVRAEIDGRLWITRSDMAYSAGDLARAKLELGDRLELVGDTLPNAALASSPDVLEQFPCMDPRGDNQIIGWDLFRPFVFEGGVASNFPGLVR